MGGILQMLGMTGEQSSQLAGTIGATAGTAAEQVGPTATQAALNAGQNLNAAAGPAAQAVQSATSAGGTVSSTQRNTPNPTQPAPAQPGGTLSPGAHTREGFFQKLVGMNPISQAAPGKAITQPFKVVGDLGHVTKTVDKTFAQGKEYIQNAGHSATPQAPVQSFGTPDALRINFGQPSNAQYAASQHPSFEASPERMMQEEGGGAGAPPSADAAPATPQPDGWDKASNILSRILYGEDAKGNNVAGSGERFTRMVGKTATTLGAGSHSGKAGEPVQPPPPPPPDPRDPNSPSILELILNMLGGQGQPPSGSSTGATRG